MVPLEKAGRNQRQRQLTPYEASPHPYLEVAVGYGINPMKKSCVVKSQIRRFFDLDFMLMPLLERKTLL
jgi:hypothetical protein